MYMHDIHVRQRWVQSTGYFPLYVTKYNVVGGCYKLYCDPCDSAVSSSHQRGICSACLVHHRFMYGGRMYVYMSLFGCELNP